MRRDMLQALLEARLAKRPVALVTFVGSGRQALVSADFVLGDIDAGGDAAAAARRALDAGRSGLLELAGEEVFLHVHAPPLRLIIIGAVHIAQSLAPLAADLDYEVVMIDPRRAFASAHRFPDLEVVSDWPDEALQRLDLDRRSALVTLTHDPKLDDAALKVALGSDVFYIGCLGSRRTHATRCKRLTDAGFSEAQIARIHAPVGLDIGAQTPAEIALAIMAQITDVLRRREAR